MTCTDVATAAAALELLTTGWTADVAILDMAMPDMDGQQLALEIRRLPTGGQLPLVLLTSVQQRVADDSRGLFAATLSKPARRAVLQEKLLVALAPAERPC